MLDEGMMTCTIKASRQVRYNDSVTKGTGAWKLEQYPSLRRFVEKEMRGHVTVHGQVTASGNETTGTVM